MSTEIDGSTSTYVIQGHPQEQETGVGYCSVRTSSECSARLVKYMVNCSEECHLIVLIFLILESGVRKKYEKSEGND